MGPISSCVTAGEVAIWRYQRDTKTGSGFPGSSTAFRYAPCSVLCYRADSTGWRQKGATNRGGPGSDFCRYNLSVSRSIDSWQGPRDVELLLLGGSLGHVVALPPDPTKPRPSPPKSSRIRDIPCKTGILRTEYSVLRASPHFRLPSTITPYFGYTPYIRYGVLRTHLHFTCLA